VACGLCVPLCPTYRKSRNESDSPRGRVALMLALAKNDLPVSTSLESHLSLCLACRACERVCPSFVPYGDMIVSARAVLAAAHRDTGRGRPLHRLLLNGFIAKPANLRLLGRILRLYQVSGLQRLVRKSGLLKWLGLTELEANLPAIPGPQSFHGVYPAQGERKGRVALFTGCVAALADPETLRATIRLCNLLGYDVEVPPKQNCCGALHLHSGDPDAATQLMRRNIEIFSGDGTEALITAASGCGATLSEYGRHVPDDPAARSFSGKVLDISRFLAEHGWPENLAFKPLPKRIAVHDPCTLANVLHGQDKPHALLKKIPGAEIVPLPENHLCCGAAGTYHLTQPDMAHRLRADKIEHLRRLAPDVLATSNIGCALYLAAGIREAGMNIEVVHPVALLARQVRDPRDEIRE